MEAQIIEAIKFLVALGISVFGLIKATQVYAQENSVGKKAIGDMATKLEAIRVDTESVKRKLEQTGNENEDLKKSVRRLDEHVSELIQTMFKYIQGKPR